MACVDVPAEPTLMAFWGQHKAECRPVGDIVSDARAGKLVGVEPLHSGFGFRVTDEAAALNAMRKKDLV